MQIDIHLITGISVSQSYTRFRRISQGSSQIVIVNFHKFDIFIDSESSVRLINNHKDKEHRKIFPK